MTVRIVENRLGAIRVQFDFGETVTADPIGRSHQIGYLKKEHCLIL